MPPFSSGDTVTLTCDTTAQDQGWAYHWERDNKQLPHKTSKSITVPVPVPGKYYQYRCCVTRKGDSRLRSNFDTVDIFAKGGYLWLTADLLNMDEKIK